MFDQYSLNSIVMTTKKGQYKQFNLEEQTDIFDWLNYASLDVVDDLNRETELIIKHANRAKVILI